MRAFRVSIEKKGMRKARLTLPPSNATRLYPKDWEFLGFALKRGALPPPPPGEHWTEMFWNPSPWPQKTGDCSCLCHHLGTWDHLIGWRILITKLDAIPALRKCFSFCMCSNTTVCVTWPENLLAAITYSAVRNLSTLLCTQTCTAQWEDSAALKFADWQNCR